MATTKVWVRTCQSCGHNQLGVDPMKLITMAALSTWNNKKCNKCTSNDLDYGSDAWTVVEGKLVRDPINPDDWN